MSLLGATKFDILEGRLSFSIPISGTSPVLGRGVQLVLMAADQKLWLNIENTESSTQSSRYSSRMMWRILF